MAGSAPQNGGVDEGFALLEARAGQVADEQTIADLDQTTSDADETGSESDQTASERDQTASYHDKAQADADQRASNRDQVAADRDRAADPAPDVNGDYEASRADRLEGTLERAETARARADTAAERLKTAAWRDESAQLRDLSALARDRAAAQRDLAAARLDRERGLSRSSAETARDYAADVRARAAAERTRAAADRKAAAADRAAAARDRELLIRELRQAQLDPLTGALGRGLGEVALEREINRARHGTGLLVLAFVDVDKLKQINDGEGHAAGDALLKKVVAVIKAHLRSYDPIVRVGGDEFVCALGDCTTEDARRRFQEIQATIKQTHPAASISVGFARLYPADTLQQLTERGDKALYDAKQNR
jgi:diguanylate cyclase (GGDEF)-like protein